MPPGRPPKRPGDPAEALVALSDNPAAGPRLKQARLDRGPEEFSNVVKNKLQSYTRTGQACDRCKVRKTLIQVRARGKPAVRSANCLAMHRCARSAATLFRKDAPTAQTRTSNAMSQTESPAAPSGAATCSSWSARRRACSITFEIWKSSCSQVVLKFAPGNGRLTDRHAHLASPSTTWAILCKTRTPKINGHRSDPSG